MIEIIIILFKININLISFYFLKQIELKIKKL